MKKVKSLYLFSMAVILFLIGVFVLLNLMGYKLNKQYFSYDHEACIDSKKAEINSCTFWMRANYIESEQNWEDEFEKSLVTKGLKTYCDTPSEWDRSKRPMSLSGPEECRYLSYLDTKHQENWSYLVSEENDDIRNYCVIEEGCEKPTLFK